MNFIGAIFNAVIRFADGSETTISRALLTVLFGFGAAGTAYASTVQVVPSVIFGVCAAICIQSGYTGWENLKAQALRGFVPGIAIVGLLLTADRIMYGWLGLGAMELDLAGLVLLPVFYTVAYAVYFGIDKIRPPIGTWEQWCRAIQGSLLTVAGAFL